MKATTKNEMILIIQTKEETLWAELQDMETYFGRDHELTMNATRSWATIKYLMDDLGIKTLQKIKLESLITNSNKGTI